MMLRVKVRRVGGEEWLKGERVTINGDELVVWEYGDARHRIPLSQVHGIEPDSTDRDGGMMGGFF